MSLLNVASQCAIGLRRAGRQGFEGGALMHAGSSEKEIFRQGWPAQVPMRVLAVQHAASRRVDDARHGMAHGAT